MIHGTFRNHLPWVAMTLPGDGSSVTIDLVVDTGFEGDLALPSLIATRTAAVFSHRTARQLADGTHRQCDVYQLELEWNDEQRWVEVLALEGKPLLGTYLLEGSHLSIDLHEGGDVLIELPE